MGNATENALMSAEDVARAFDVERSTVSRWARDGRLKHFKTPGGHYRFQRADVERLLPEILRSEAS